MIYIFLRAGGQPGIKCLWGEGQRPGQDLEQKQAIAFNFVSKAFLLVAGMALAPCPGSNDWPQRGACFCSSMGPSHPLTLPPWWLLKGLRGLAQDLG